MSGAFGIEQPLAPVRCGNCGRLVAEHFSGGEFVGKCGRCGVQVVIAGARLVNAAWTAPAKKS